MNGRKYYIIAPNGELGPFAIDELIEEVKGGRIEVTQQVRSGMGTMLGTVADVFESAKIKLKNQSQYSGSVVGMTTDNLAAVEMEQQRSRRFSMIVLMLTVVPALLLIWLLKGRDESTPSAQPNKQESAVKILELPPPALNREITSSATSQPKINQPPPQSIVPPSVMPAAQHDAGNDVVRQDPSGVLILSASTATITTKGARLQGVGSDTVRIGSWNDEKGGLEWRAIVDQPGAFQVTITYACNHSGAGSILKLTANEESITEATRNSGTWDDYKPHLLKKSLIIRDNGEIVFTLAPESKKSAAFMKFVDIKLSPITQAH